MLETRIERPLVDPPGVGTTRVLCLRVASSDSGDSDPIRRGRPSYLYVRPRTALRAHDQLKNRSVFAAA